jgi:hypothetical protein
MFNLKDPNISYIVLSNNVAESSNYLYSRGHYRVIEMSSYFHGSFDKSCFAVTNTVDNDTLRHDSIKIMHLFNEKDVIVKYIGENSPVKILEDGTEQPMGVIMYNTDSEKKSFIYEGVSFSFTEKQLYYFPKTKEDFKNGMIIECLNNNNWTEKRVFDLDKEYENMYKILIKYNKIRIPA